MPGWDPGTEAGAQGPDPLQWSGKGRDLSIPPSLQFPVTLMEFGLADKIPDGSFRPLA